MAVKQIASGNDLMVFIADASNNYKSIACATGHTLSITGEAQAINSKDHGKFTANEVNKISWEISSENLYTTDYGSLFSAMLNGTKLNLKFAPKSQSYTLDSSAGATSYTPDASIYMSGKAVITSLSLNANSGENATYSVTFTGDGEISSTGLANNYTGGSNGGNGGNGGSTQSYTLTVTSDSPSIGTVSGGGQKVAGSSVTVTATVTSPGATFSGWYNGNSLLSSNTSYTLTMPASNYTLTAKFSGENDG